MRRRCWRCSSTRCRRPFTTAARTRRRRSTCSRWWTRARWRGRRRAARRPSRRRSTRPARRSTSRAAPRPRRPAEQRCALARPRILGAGGVRAEGRAGRAGCRTSRALWRVAYAVLCVPRRAARARSARRTATWTRWRSSRSCRRRCACSSRRSSRCAHCRCSSSPLLAWRAAPAARQRRCLFVRRGAGRRAERGARCAACVWVRAGVWHAAARRVRHAARGGRLRAAAGRPAAAGGAGAGVAGHRRAHGRRGARRRRRRQRRCARQRRRLLTCPAATRAREGIAPKPCAPSRAWLLAVPCAADYRNKQQAPQQPQQQAAYNAQFAAQQQQQAARPAMGGLPAGGMTPQQQQAFSVMQQTLVALRGNGVQQLMQMGPQLVGRRVAVSGRRGGERPARFERWGAATGCGGGATQRGWRATWGRGRRPPAAVGSCCGPAESGSRAGGVGRRSGSRRLGAELMR